MWNRKSASRRSDFASRFPTGSLHQPNLSDLHRGRTTEPQSSAGPRGDEGWGQTAISWQRTWNRYKQQSAKGFWPGTVRAIDWLIDPLNCSSWARLHLGSIKHSSIFGPRQRWWQRLIRKHLSMLSQSPRVNASVLWELLDSYFFLSFFLLIC